MKHNGGFTLIEIVISIAIISISLVTLVSAFNRTAVAAAESSVLTGATMLGQEKITVANDAEFPETGEGKWETDERYPRYRFRKAVTQTPFLDVRLVTVQVQYDLKNAFDIQGYMIKK
jgi:prepilin-type N-terminal cleavage/methylation domain-containing protein